MYSDENRQAIWVFSLYENTYLETLQNLFNMTVTVFVWIKLVETKELFMLAQFICWFNRLFLPEMQTKMKEVFLLL